MKDWLVVNPEQETLTVKAKRIVMPYKEEPIVAFEGEASSLIGVAHLAPGGTVMLKPE